MSKMYYNLLKNDKRFNKAPVGAEATPSLISASTTKAGGGSEGAAAGTSGDPQQRSGTDGAAPPPGLGLGPGPGPGLGPDPGPGPGLSPAKTAHQQTDVPRPSDDSEAQVTVHFFGLLSTPIWLHRCRP
jgi:hypothetical protein